MQITKMSKKINITLMDKEMNDKMVEKITDFAIIALIKKSDSSEIAKYISENLSSEYGGNWFVTVSPKPKKHSTYFHKEKGTQISFEIEDQTFDVSKIQTCLGKISHSFNLAKFRK